MDQEGKRSVIVVVDTNIMVEALLLPGGQVAAKVKQFDLIAPEFLLLELGNVLRKYHHFSGLEAKDIFFYINNTMNIIKEWIPNGNIFEEALQLSLNYNHAIYDCLFLAAAKIYRLPLWTMDKKLNDRARALELEVVHANSKF